MAWSEKGPRGWEIRRPDGEAYATTSTNTASATERPFSRVEPVRLARRLKPKAS